MIINQSVVGISSSDQRYLDYVTSHQLRVRRAWEVYLRKHFYGVKLVKIDALIDQHDIDKLDPENFESRVDHYYPESHGSRFLTVESPVESEEFSKVTNSHKVNNGHHWEYWLDDNGNPKEMPLEYIAEMLCDWSSFQFIKRPKGRANTWYFNHKDEIVLHPKTRKKVEYYLDLEPGL